MSNLRFGYRGDTEKIRDAGIIECVLQAAEIQDRRIASGRLPAPEMWTPGLRPPSGRLHNPWGRD